ncbi:hypothetical protein CPB86DRAFT_266755 [Serendipita vermifera]|nr:hypothetical protein CPB86DRAFT_266755 [Serendipita vermifera]
MDSNPWGNAWAEPSKDTVQEVVVKPKEESWIASPASGDIGVAWSTQWESHADSHTTWHPQESTVASLNTPWNLKSEISTTETVRVDDNPIYETEQVSQGEDDQQEVSHSSPNKAFTYLNDENIVESSITSNAIPVNEIPQTTGISLPATPAVDEEADSLSKWRTLGNAAITVGDEAAWDTAWKTPSNDEPQAAYSPTSENQPVDEWSSAIAEKAKMDAIIPPELMDLVMERFQELSNIMWPGEDLEAIRDVPAPRAEWQGGLENVDGLASIVNRYIPPPPVISPINFADTPIAGPMQTAVKLTRSLGIIQKSPLNRLTQASDSWGSSMLRQSGRGQSFRLENWLQEKAPINSSTLNSSIEEKGYDKKPTGVMGFFSRSSMDQGRLSALTSSSSTPRTSLDGTTLTTTSVPSPIIQSTTPQSLSSEPTNPPQPASAVSRFLNRFSRRVDDQPKTPPPMTLRSDELDFLDMAPAIAQGRSAAEMAINATPDIGKLAHPQMIPFSGIIAPPSVTTGPTDSSRRKGANSGPANLSQLSSQDFDNLLDAQIQEVEDEKLRESLVAAALISEPTSSNYSQLGRQLWGPKTNKDGAKPLNELSSLSTQSNSLFDDDEFDAFLATPSKSTASSQKPASTVPSSTFTLSPGISTSNIARTSTPPLIPRPANKASPTPSRTSTIAIMNTSTSRSSTPLTPQIAPLLPPPPGSRLARPAPSMDLLNERSTSATSATSNGPTSSGMGDLSSLITPPSNTMQSLVQPSKPASKLVTSSNNSKFNAGGLSAQDLSFFEGL